MKHLYFEYQICDYKLVVLLGQMSFTVIHNLPTILIILELNLDPGCASFKLVSLWFLVIDCPLIFCKAKSSIFDLLFICNFYINLSIKLDEFDCNYFIVAALHSLVFIRIKLTMVSDKVGMNFSARKEDLGMISLGNMSAFLLGDLLPFARF